LQNTTTLQAAAAEGSNNIKVANVTNFSLDQKIIIGSGVNSDTVVIKNIGTAGGSTLGTAISSGATVIPVVGVEGFGVGQSITLDSGANIEIVVIASITSGRFRFGSRSNNPVDSIRITVPLTKAHNVGTQVSGSGITLASPLIRTHENGTQVAGNVPTPGKPNEYIRNHSIKH
jgi:hypothetical protein